MHVLSRQRVRHGAGGVSYDSVMEETGTETASMVQRAKDIHLTIHEGAKAFMRFQVPTPSLSPPALLALPRRHSPQPELVASRRACHPRK
jgi:hypothetical protein